MSDLAEEKRRKTEAALLFAKEAARKFVAKVESGRARSWETYADMQRLLILIEEVLNS
jgi:hypothetical protein